MSIRKKMKEIWEEDENPLFTPTIILLLIFLACFVVWGVKETNKYKVKEVQKIERPSGEIW